MFGRKVSFLAAAGLKGMRRARRGLALCVGLAGLVSAGVTQAGDEVTSTGDLWIYPLESYAHFQTSEWTGSALEEDFNPLPAIREVEFEQTTTLHGDGTFDIYEYLNGQEFNDSDDLGYAPDTGWYPVTLVVDFEGMQLGSTIAAYDWVLTPSDHCSGGPYGTSTSNGGNHHGQDIYVGYAWLSSGYDLVLDVSGWVTTNGTDDVKVNTYCFVHL